MTSPLLASSDPSSCSFLLAFSSSAQSPPHHLPPPPSLPDLRASASVNPSDIVVSSHHLFDNNVPLSLDMVASMASSVQSQTHCNAEQISEETQLTTPTMHPNLVSTLKSIICPSPSSPPDRDVDASTTSPPPAQYASGLDPVSAQYVSTLECLPAFYGVPIVSSASFSSFSSSLSSSSSSSAYSSSSLSSSCSSSSMQGNVLSHLSLQPLFIGSDPTRLCSVDQKRRHHEIEQEQSLLSIQDFFNAGVPSAAAEAELGKLAQKQSMEQKKQCATIVPIHLIQNRRPYRCGYGGCVKTFKNPQTLRMHHKTHNSSGSRASKGERKKGGGSNGGEDLRGDESGLLKKRRAGEASDASGSLVTVPASPRAGQNKKIPSRCPVCKRAFVGLYELRRHFGRKHSEGEKGHACSKCGKRFYIEVDLRDHQKLCGEPLVCSCGMKFAFKCNLVAHRKKRTHPSCHQDPVKEPEQLATTTIAAEQEHHALQDLSLHQGFIPTAIQPTSNFSLGASAMAGSSQTPVMASVYSSSPPNLSFLPPHCSPFHSHGMKSEQLQCTQWLASTSAL